MPGPVSSTVKTIELPFGDRQHAPPVGVNLTALLSRLMSARRSLRGSGMKLTGLRSVNASPRDSAKGQDDGADFMRLLE